MAWYWIVLLVIMIGVQIYFVVTIIEGDTLKEMRERNQEDRVNYPDPLFTIIVLLLIGFPLVLIAIIIEVYNDKP